MNNHDTTLPWTLRAIARLERDVSRPLRHRRLTEANWASWRRVAGRLGWSAFVALLHEDLATAFPTAFDFARRKEDPLAGLTEAEAATLIRDAVSAGYADTQSFLRSAAQGLGLPAGATLTDLPKVQPFQRIIELPGSGGRIAAQQTLSHPDLSFDRQFLFVADTDAERVLIGIAALELRANEPEIVTTADVRDVLRGGARLDKAYGLLASTTAGAAIEAVRSAGKEVRCI